ncbi:MAG TPA: TetR/AcrR family transcriptional regulator [Pseudonocardiaceae bacterium]|nr:TetR/AcrR family transcriptional regulator [Pseudonocardiaceae bacterium]
MTETTRRERTRDETEQEIRRVARDLLVSQGREAVTLRAIAREMGITAPAIYRYHASLEHLIRQLCLDVCTDLAAELAQDLATISERDTTAQVFAICRGFRAWALGHPQEFSLVFASPATPAGSPSATTHDVTDPFGRIFLSVAGRVLATRELAMPAVSEVPAELRADLTEFRRTLFDTLAEAGLDIPEHVFPIGAAYTMLRFWVRLYGQVALEVFGRFPFAVSAPEPLFESMLAELAAEVGLID